MWLDHSVATPTGLILRDREAIVSKDEFGPLYLFACSFTDM